jgi:hypothetical protein
VRNIADILVLIVWLAIIATLVAHKGTGEVITSIGNAFSNSIKAAKAE